MALTPIIKAHFYGDSHFCDRHFFREAMNEATSGIKDWRFSTVDERCIHALGGAFLDLNMIESFCEMMEKEGPFPQVHVFQAGGNNLREIVKGHSKETKDDVLKLFKLLVTKAGNEKNVHLVFCSIIPSPKHEPLSNEIFWELNQELKKLASAHPEMVSFVDLKLVAGIEHRAKKDLFSRDQIHLSQQGVFFAAKQISQFLQHLPAAYFGIPSRKDVFKIVNTE